MHRGSSFLPGRRVMIWAFLHQGEHSCQAVERRVIPLMFWSEAMGADMMNMGTGH